MHSLAEEKSPEVEDHFTPSVNHFYLNQTFTITSFRQNLMSIFILDKSSYHFIFKDRKFSLFQNLIVIGS